MEEGQCDQLCSWFQKLFLVVVSNGCVFVSIYNYCELKLKVCSLPVLIIEFISRVLPSHLGPPSIFRSPTFNFTTNSIHYSVECTEAGIQEVCYSE
jgi:hypothetical protein